MPRDGFSRPPWSRVGLWDSRGAARMTGSPPKDVNGQFQNALRYPQGSEGERVRLEALREAIAPVGPASTPPRVMGGEPIGGGLGLLVERVEPDGEAEPGVGFREPTNGLASRPQASDQRRIGSAGGRRGPGDETPQRVERLGGSPERCRRLVIADRVERRAPSPKTASR